MSLTKRKTIFFRKGADLLLSLRARAALNTSRRTAAALSPEKGGSGSQGRLGGLPVARTHEVSYD